MTDFNLEHENAGGQYVVKIDVPDHDLAATPLDTVVDMVEVEKPNPDHDPENPDSPEKIAAVEPGPDHGKAVFTWPADPPIDPESVTEENPEGTPLLSRKEYEAMQQREAALLVKDAIQRAQPAPAGKSVKVDVPASLDAVE